MVSSVHRDPCVTDSKVEYIQRDSDLGSQDVGLCFSEG